MASKLIIYGGKPLLGQVRVSGAKNAALPILAASLLTQETLRLIQVPHLIDITVMLQLLSDLGVEVGLDDQGHIELTAAKISKLSVSYTLVKAMRASIVVLGPLVARFGHARVALPGGCAIGARPIDVHLSGLSAMGAEVKMEEGYVMAKAPPGGLKAARIKMPVVSVTGTENLMMAATLAKGTTVIENAAKEPEVSDLAELLIQMGAIIKGHGTSTITIEGRDKLDGAVHEVLADRIEAGTYLTAAAMTGGSVCVSGIAPEIMRNVTMPLEKSGASIRTSKEGIHICMKGRTLRAVDIQTSPYPGFPTDMQAQLMALNSVACGESIIEETIFENRFMHVPEFGRLGAKISIKGNKAICLGQNALSGAPVRATDLRASAGLVLAGLVANGTTIIEGVQHMDRGYERLEEKFKGLGADIVRVEE